MARRGRSRSITGSSADTSDITLGPDLNGLLEPLPALPVDPVSIIDEFTQPAIPYDRRAFSFGEEWQSPKMEVRNDVLSGQTKQVSERPSGQLPSGVVVSDPGRLAVCVRRKERREVLFALRKTFRGGRGNGKRRYNEWSKVHCR